MRTRPSNWAPLLSIALLGPLAACSNGLAPPPLPGAAASTSSAASGSSGSSASVFTPPADAGEDAHCPAPDAGVAGAFSYTPQGCSYTVTPAPLLGYTATALDDDSPAGSMGTPVRVRLGLGGGTTSCAAGYPDLATTAAFTWETGAANTAAKVRYGTSASALGTTQSGYVFTLPATSSGAAVYMHEAHVCGLTPATTYYYQVGGGAPGQEVWSATQSFTTLPEKQAPVTIGVFGDARDSATVWTLANQHMKEKNPAAILFSGDLVYLGGDQAEFAQWLDAIWTDPSNAGQFLTLGQIMLLPTAGNHEYYLDSTADNFYAAFALPGSGQWAKSFGSYNIGIAHIAFLDDDQIANEFPGTDIPQADAQLAWLESDLAAADADRKNHPFVFVMSHRGIFSTSMHSADMDVLQARTLLAPIFARHKVDAVFNGHDHEYERTFPIVPGNPVTGDPTVPPAGSAFPGTTYVICAGAGALPYDVGTEPVSWRAAKVPFGSSGTGAQASYQGVYQTVTLDPTARTATLTAYALTGATDPVIDTYTIHAQAAQ